MEKTLRIPIRTRHIAANPLKASGSWRLWVGTGLAALIVRLAFSMGLGLLWHPEPWEPEAIANHLLAGDGFIFEHLNTIYRSYCEPLYPGLAAVVYALTQHSQPALVLVQIFLSAATAVFAAQCAWYVTGDKRVAGLAGLLVAVHPGLVLYTTKLHPLALDSLFITLVVWACLRYASLPGRGRAAMIGATGGLCVLTRPTILAALPVICWWAWHKSERSLGVRLKRIGLILGLMGALVSPWVIRNYIVHGQFMLTRSNTPFVFWLGNHPQATGSALDSQARDVLYLSPPAFLKKIESSDELTQNRLFGEAAAAYVRSDPLGFLWRTWKKWVYFWWFTPQAGILYPKTWFQGYRLWWFFMACAGLWGLWRSRTLPAPSRISFWFVIAVTAAIGGAQSLFYIEGRHRLAIEPLLSCIIAFGIAEVLWRPDRR